MLFELTILGCSSAVPVYGRSLTAQVLNIKNRLFLIDCGEGTQFQLMKYKISYNKIQKIFISHLHGDHVYGLPGLINTMNLSDRQKPLKVYGPVGIKTMLDFIFELSGRNEFGFDLEIIELPVDKHLKIFEDKELKVYAFPLIHSLPTIGYRFEEKNILKNIKPDAILKYNLNYEQIKAAKRGEDIIMDSGETIKNSSVTFIAKKPRSYAYCSDTRYSEKYIPYVKNVDLLYHESTYIHEMKEKAQNRFHSTNVEAALVAKKANAGKLILGHYSSRYKDLTPMLEEARTVFANTDLALDGKRFEVKTDEDE